MSFLLELASMPITPGPGMNLHSVMTGKVRKPVFLMMERLTKEDGKGKWWEGYDPQDLYAQNHPLSEGRLEQWYDP